MVELVLPSLTSQRRERLDVFPLGGVCRKIQLSFLDLTGWVVLLGLVEKKSIFGFVDASMQWIGCDFWLHDLWIVPFCCFSLSAIGMMSCTIRLVVIPPIQDGIQILSFESRMWTFVFCPFGRLRCWLLLDKTNVNRSRSYCVFGIRSDCDNNKLMDEQLVIIELENWYVPRSVPLLRWMWKLGAHIPVDLIPQFADCYDNFG